MSFSTPPKCVDFFIVGAPKAGTTALFEYLKRHPSVFLPTHKEPHYFSQDYPNIGGRIRELKDYEALFDGKSLGQKAGDASVCYFGSQSAANEIHDYNPEAKVIVMLRNPVDLFLSEHSQLLYSFYESEKDPARAWDLQEEREQGRSLPGGCREPMVLRYRQTCALGSNLARIYSVFPKDQVLPVLFDDFVRNTGGVYRDVLQFIGVDDDGRTDFPKVNERKAHRSGLIARFLIAPPGFLANWHAALRRRVAVSGSPVLQRVEDMARKFLVLISREGDKPKITEADYKRIQGDLAPEVEKLSELMGRDLSSWNR
ncbi:sulfotransferase family protein [Aestuariirhabdus sp. LZHN29]|uniref:sulfotransferase family protein n=1 Tax=Aestuariirhabdus sp. LZHN29 TaxID=3417462 RepID=UPI003CEA0E80